MFLRTHRIGRHTYTEVLESFRDPDTGRPRHRCLARWHADRSFAEELGRARFDIERATENLAYYQGVIDRAVRPRILRHRKEAPKYAARWRRLLSKATAHLAALTAAREAGLPADDAEVEQARQTKWREWESLTASFRAALSSSPAPDLSGLADRVRRLESYNDPEAMREEIKDIAAAMDAIAVTQP